MPYFMGIITRQSMQSGRMIPDYVLCKYDNKQNDIPFCLVDVRQVNYNFHPVLFASPAGHEQAIEYLSYHRVRDLTVDEDGQPSHRKFFPKGALFLFQCNKYGDREGALLFIKFVPQKRPRSERQMEGERLKQIRKSRRIYPDMFEPQNYCYNIEAYRK